MASPGRPVLRDNRPADFGPAELITIGRQTPIHAVSIVVDWANKSEKWEERELAAQYTRQWPEGPQVQVGRPNQSEARPTSLLRRRAKF